MKQRRSPLAYFKVPAMCCQTKVETVPVATVLAIAATIPVVALVACFVWVWVQPRSVLSLWCRLNESSVQLFCSMLLRK